MDKFISTFKTKVINRQFGYFLLTSDDRMLAYCMMVAEVMVDDYWETILAIERKGEGPYNSTAPLYLTT